ncbi:MAG: hypothetical protein CSYNP_04256 [Syntrophus sp. SKADARSKE-3]|nr:hypothetical protein [Syntrophus sp. SKADARSKE-3]
MNQSCKVDDFNQSAELSTSAAELYGARRMETSRRCWAITSAAALTGFSMQF